MEALFPGAAAIQRDMLAKNPDFLDIPRTVFGGFPVLEQFRIQAQGERLGAATWRSLARKEESRSRARSISPARSWSRPARWCWKPSAEILR